MNHPPDQNTRRWVETWKRAGAALDAVHRRELAAFDYAKNQRVIDEMLQWAFEHRQERLTSGLVEQQRLFMRMHPKAAPGCRRSQRSQP